MFASSQADLASDHNASISQPFFGKEGYDNNMIDNDYYSCFQAGPSCSPQDETVSMDSPTLPLDALLFSTASAASSAQAALEFSSHSAPHSTVAAVAAFVSAAVLLALLGQLLRRRPLVQRQRDVGRSCYSDHIFPASTRLPPCSVPAHPIFGHLSNLFSPPDSPAFTSVMYDNANPSGLSTLRFMHVPSVSLLKAEHARIVLRDSIERRSFSFMARHFRQSLGQDSLVMMQGGASDREKWRLHRNLMKPAFTTHAVGNMAGRVLKVANGFASSILRECSKEGANKEGSYRAEADVIFKWATLDVFGEVALNYRFGCTDTLTTTPLARSIEYTVEDSNTRCLPANLLSPSHQIYWLPTRRNREFKRHSDNVHGLIREMCQQRMREMRAQEENEPANQGPRRSKDGDLLTALLRSKAESQDVKPDDSYEDLIKMLLTLFFAGYDTSSVLLSMVMWSVAKHPEIQRECAREANECERRLDEDASRWQSELPYCHAVIMETMRLHPPVYMNCRNLQRDIVLDGYTIPKRTRVYLPVMQIHADERNFARPTEFLPERWVRKDHSTGRWAARDYRNEQPQSMEGNDNDDASYVPPANPQNIFTFSDGARNCVGYRLALQESTLIFACLVRDLTVDVPEGYVMETRRKFALAVPNEMPLIFRKREKGHATRR